MNFQPVDRLPAIEYTPYWDQTQERWYTEGLPRQLVQSYEIREHLGLDTWRYAWVGCPRGDWERRVADRSDYEEACKTVYPSPAFSERIRRKLSAAQELGTRGEAVVWLLMDGFFWHPRCLLGIEPHLLAFHDQPQLMHRMNQDLLAYNLRVLDEAFALGPLAFVAIGEDFCYRQGPMISRPCFDEFLAPYYRPLVAAMKRRGAIPFVDTDGNVHEAIPWLEAVGIEGLAPMEIRAGNDLGRIRREHPRLRMIGGFDKTVMKDGEPAIRRELERLLPIAAAGGFIPSVDHQTPPDVAFDSYLVYVRLLREYCDRAAQLP